MSDGTSKRGNHNQTPRLEENSDDKLCCFLRPSPSAPNGTGKYVYSIPLIPPAAPGDSRSVQVASLRKVKYNPSVVHPGTMTHQSFPQKLNQPSAGRKDNPRLPSSTTYIQEPGSRETLLRLPPFTGHWAPPQFVNYHNSSLFPHTQNPYADRTPIGTSFASFSLSFAWLIRVFIATIVKSV
jgi:hypothetical protein